MTMRASLRATAIAVALALPVAACETPVPAPVFAQLTYAHLGAINLDVAKVEVVDQYVPPLKHPNVEHEFPITPAAAARRWAADRIKAVGLGRTARVLVRSAAVRVKPLAKSQGLRGLFTAEESERYDGELAMTIEIRSERGFREAFAEARATRSRTVLENISLNQRTQVYFEMTEGLMIDLNAELEKNIRRHLARFVR